MPDLRDVPKELLDRGDAIHALRALLRGQDQVFHLDQSRLLGVRDDKVWAMVRRGELVRMHTGVYRTATAAINERVRLRAALLGAEEAVASHASAARLMGLPGGPVGRPEISVPDWSVKRMRGVRLHRSRKLDGEEHTTWSGLPCTTASRTVIDLATRLDQPGRLQLVDEAIWGGHCTRERLHAQARVLSPGRKGVTEVAAITAPGAEEPFRSWFERRFGALRRALGLPAPIVNAPLRLEGRLLLLDNLWEPQRLVVELHGLRFHDTPDALTRDAERTNLLVIAGFRVLTFTWHQVVDTPDEVGRTLRAALRP